MEGHGPFCILIGLFKPPGGERIERKAEELVGILILATGSGSMTPLLLQSQMPTYFLPPIFTASGNGPINPRCLSQKPGNQPWVFFILIINQSSSKCLFLSISLNSEPFSPSTTPPKIPPLLCLALISSGLLIAVSVAYLHSKQVILHHAWKAFTVACMIKSKLLNRVFRPYLLCPQYLLAIVTAHLYFVEQAHVSLPWHILYLLSMVSFSPVALAHSYSAHASLLSWSHL